MDLISLSKETLISIIEDQRAIIKQYEISNDNSKRQCWRLQVWGGCQNGKSQSENKRRIMELMYEKKIHLVDLIKHNSFNEINTHREKQLNRVSKGDKVFMCDNNHTYYEGFLQDDYTHCPRQSMIDKYPEVIGIVWGTSCTTDNVSPFIYIAPIHWEKKELTNDMKTYLMKSVKNGGGRIDMQGTILKLNYNSYKDESPV